MLHGIALCWHNLRHHLTPKELDIPRRSRLEGHIYTIHTLIHLMINRNCPFPERMTVGEIERHNGEQNTLHGGFPFPFSFPFVLRPVTLMNTFTTKNDDHAMTFWDLLLHSIYFYFYVYEAQLAWTGLTAATMSLKVGLRRLEFRCVDKS